jgi:hypothetical protein
MRMKAKYYASSASSKSPSLPEIDRDGGGISRARSAARASMALRVVRARLDGLRDGLLVFFVGVVVFRVAAAVYFLTHLLVAAAPVVMLASGVAVA